VTGLLSHLVGAEVDPRVRELRGRGLDHSEGVHRALVETDDDRFGHADRVGLALATAREIDDPVLVEWFGQLTEDAGEPSPTTMATWRDLLVTMTHRPHEVDRAMVEALVAEHGEARVVVVTELVSYLAYLSRLVLALSGRPAGEPERPSPGAMTVTMRPRRWEPYVQPLPVRELDDPSMSEAEREAFAATGKGSEKQEYWRVLAHDPASLRERSGMYNLIMYDEGGLGHGDREFAALWTSLRNGCPYCASVHVRRLQVHTDRATAEAALAAGLAGGTGLADLDERRRAVAEVAEALTDRDADRLATALEAARAAGLDAVERFDLVAVVAVFGWANRLMLALGSSSEIPPRS